MKFWEAMRALEEGKKVYCTTWKCGYICKSENYQWKVCSLAADIDEEWELYEEPEKLLTFSEVVKGLKEGKRFRRKGWVGQPHLWIMLEDRENSERFLIFECGLTSNIYKFTMFDFEATDWVEVR